MRINTTNCYNKKKCSDASSLEASERNKSLVNGGRGTAGKRNRKKKKEKRNSSLQLGAVHVQKLRNKKIGGGGGGGKKQVLLWCVIYLSGVPMATQWPTGTSALDKKSSSEIRSVS